MNDGVYNILRKRYPANEYALMAEVSNAAGHARNRSADYILMGLWPSRGLHLSGFELKSHRSDWLSELKNPAKAETFFKYCDFWWLITVGDGVAKKEEIPGPWGWMVIVNDKILVKKEAPKNQEPVELTRGFLAALLKRASDKTEFVHRDSIKEEITKSNENAVRFVKQDLERTKSEYISYQKQVSEFEKKSGINIGHTWNGEAEKFGNAIRRLTEDGGVESLKNDLLRLEKSASEIHQRINITLSTIKEIPTE